MKKFVMVMLLIFTAINFGQSNIKYHYDATASSNEVHDSTYALWIDSTGSAVDSLVGSYKIIKLNQDYEWATITFSDTGATYTDSMSVKFAMMSQGDTVWQPLPFFKDSSYTIVGQPIVDNSSIKSYMLWVAPYKMIKISMDNTVITNRKVNYFDILFSRGN